MKIMFPVLLLALLPSAALADRVGISTPTTWETCSPSGQYCARLDPDENRITAYRAGAKEVVLWTAGDWSSVAALADDGEHLMLGYKGMSLIPVNYDPEMKMLTFYRRGEVIQRVTLSALIDRAAMQRTVSHWYWGNYLELDADGRYAVRTADGRKIRFDMTTGMPIR